MTAAEAERFGGVIFVAVQFGHLGTITNTAARLCDRLGLTPTSRAALGLAVSQTCR